jgi:hypothetical protein
MACCDFSEQRSSSMIFLEFLSRSPHFPVVPSGRVTTAFLSNSLLLFGGQIPRQSYSLPHLHPATIASSILDTHNPESMIVLISKFNAKQVMELPSGRETTDSEFVTTSAGLSQIPGHSIGTPQVQPAFFASSTSPGISAQRSGSIVWSNNISNSEQVPVVPSLSVTTMFGVSI